MSRKWAATESDSEDEEHEQTPLTPVNDQPIEPLTVESSSGYDGPLSGMMMNIKYSATEDDVRQFLESNNCKIRNIEFFFRDNEFTGRARIDFIDKVSFDQFLALHDKPWDGKPIITKVYEERTPRSTGGRYGGSSSRGGGRGDRREGRGDRRDDRNINKTSSRDSRDGQRYGDFRKSNSREDKFDSRPKRPEREAKPIAKIPEEPEAPKERPRVILQPRTKPLETIGKTDKTSDIFGGGKPHDEFAYEEKKKQHVVIEKKPESEPVDELKVDKISLQEEVKPAPVEAPQPVKKEEEATVNNNTSTTAEPPKPPVTEEEEDNGHKGKYKSNKPRNNNNDRRYNNDRSSRNFTKNRSKDEPEAELSEPVGEKAEEPEQTNNEQGERKDRRSYRKPKGERFADDREFNGERKPFKKNDNKGKREKPAASSAPESQEEKKKLEVEVKAEPTKDEEGFEDYNKSKNKAKLAQKPAATSTKSTSSATTPKSSVAPVSVKNAFAGLDSDSD